MSDTTPEDETDTTPASGTTPAIVMFATVADLENRWHTLTESEQATAETLLTDATAIIMALQPHWRSIPNSVLTYVTCDMVRRAMMNRDVAGISQATQTAGSFTESMSYSNPDGDLYLTSVQKKLLRIGVQQAFHLTMGKGSCS